MSLPNEKLAWADNLGRSIAQSDAKQNAHTQELAHLAIEASYSLLKMAGAVDLVKNMYAKHPGAVIGAGLGALHGLAKDDGGIGSGILEGVGGFATGAAATGAYNHFKKQASHSSEKIRKALSAASSGRLTHFINKTEKHLDSRLKKTHFSEGTEKAKHLGRAEQLHGIKGDAEGAKLLKNIKGSNASREEYKPAKLPRPQGNKQTSLDEDNVKALLENERSRSTGRILKTGIGAGGIGFVGGSVYGYHARGRVEDQKKLDRKSKTAEFQELLEKEAFVAAIGQALKGAIPAAMNWVKANPLNAGIGAASALSNFRSARQSGQGMGSSLLSGAAGAASALPTSAPTAAGAALKTL